MNKLEISSTEWNYLKQLRHVLIGFYNATIALSAKSYPTIGSAFFYIIQIKGVLNERKKMITSLSSVLKKLLLAKMQHYFEEDQQQLNLLKVSMK